jgi:hypothetical protein
MYQYAKDDPRNTDIVGRLAYLKVLVDDADAISRVLENHARTADQVLRAGLLRFSIVARDFATAGANAFAAASPQVKAWVEKH